MPGYILSNSLPNQPRYRDLLKLTLQQNKFLRMMDLRIKNLKVKTSTSNKYYEDSFILSGMFRY